MQLSPSALVRVALRGRQKEFTIEGKTFVLQRPTAFELMRLREKSGTLLDVEVTQELLKKHVVGWKGFTEKDFSATGDDLAVDFIPELLLIWLEDRPNVWSELQVEIFNMVEAHQAKLESESKN